MGASSPDTNGISREAGAPMNVQHYVVCILDLLGQSSELKGWSELPPGEAAKTAFLSALKKSVGSVIAFKDLFTQSRERRRSAATEGSSYGRTRICSNSSWRLPESQR